ncbi:MAG: prolipoprotein diacylglyceryl transferase [Phycisphaerae bacterium]|nr:prolipoprotein diacylglyceryl transferase [Phycisphaerae bacterium]
MRQIIIDLGTVHIFGGEIPLRIFGYGLMLVCGFLAGILLAQWRAKRAGESPELVSQMGIWALVGGVVGARMAYVFKNWDSFSAGGLGEIFNVTSGGLIYFGGLLGGTITVLAYMRIKRMPIRRYIDIVAPSLMIGLAFGRMGCTLNGCCWGGPCEESWAMSIKFPMISRPLLKVGGGENPYSDGQTLCPTYSEQYWAGRVTPDARLLNAYITQTRELGENSTYRKNEGGRRVVNRQAVLPVSQLHGQLHNDQLAAMFADKAELEKLFNVAAGRDRVLSKAEWQEALAAGDGLLRGSEMWDEAIWFDRPVVMQDYYSSAAADGLLSFAEFREYFQRRADELLGQFDRNKDGRLLGQERKAANAYLQEDLYALLGNQWSNALRPAQPLGIFNGFLLAVLLMLFYRYRRREGQVFALMLIMYPITRFMLESIRHENPLNLLAGDPTHNQLTAPFMVLGGLALWWWFNRLPASAGATLAQRQKFAGVVGNAKK